MGQSVSRRIASATLVAGTLDILSAAIYAVIAGRTAVGMLQGIASAIVPTASDMGLAGAAIGLALHFAIMAVMVTVFVFAADRVAALKAHWIAAGIAYGLALYLVMFMVVLPLRFGWHPFHARGVAQMLFSHIVLVGLPIAWFARK